VQAPRAGLPRRLAALLGLGLTFALAPARSETDALALRAVEAGRLCAAEDSLAASRELVALDAALVEAGGEGHPARALVLLARSQVERALGRERTAGRLSEEARGVASGRVDAGLERALKSLRACSNVRPPPTPCWGERVAGFDDDLAAARRLLGEKRAADARAAAVALAQDRLGCGDAERAVRALALADESARRAGEVLTRIGVARLVAQAGSYEQARVELEELAGAAESAAERAELDEAWGGLELALGSPARALPRLEAAVAAQRSLYGAEDVQTAEALHLLGDAQRQLRDVGRAQAAYEEAQRIYRASRGDQDPATASLWNAIGVLRTGVGDWSGAEEAFRSALAAYEASLGPRHPEAVVVRLNRALAGWGRAREAPGDAACERAAPGYAAATLELRQALGAEHPSVAEAQRTLARLETECGRLDQAGELLAQALAAQERTLGPAHRDTTLTRLERGRLLARQGQLDAASAEVGAATAALSGALGAEHPLVARYQTSLARLAAARGDAPAAHDLSQAAGSRIAQHIQRSFGAMAERERGFLAQDSQEVVGALLSVPAASPRETWTALLPHRDSVLRSLAASRAAVRGHGPESDALLAALEEERHRYVAAVLAGTPDSAARAREIAQRIGALERRAALAGAARVEPAAAEVIARACEHLAPGAAVVEFVAHDRTTREAAAIPLPAYDALVLRPEGCRVERVDLGPAAPIERAVARFDAAMQGGQLDEPAARAELGRFLLEPLASRLRGAERWYVIPDARLWGVPVGVLPDPEARGRYLLERVTVAYLTSLHELAEAAPDASAFAAPLLVGAPEFGEGAGLTLPTPTGPCHVPPFGHLQGTLLEVEAIRPLLAPSTVVTGRDATKERLARELEGAPGLIHLATHGFFAGRAGCPVEDRSDGAGALEDWVEPHPLLLSGLVFAGANRAPDQGILTAYEVAGLDLRRARLVVLSACDTGAGVRRRGQEVQGLRWGFREAGVQALLTSLWRSNDAVTRRLMERFYRELASPDLPSDGFRAAEALRRAQLERVADDARLGLPRPRWWANFVVSGVL
jgi:CHAT domain-containing protein